MLASWWLGTDTDRDQLQETAKELLKKAMQLFDKEGVKPTEEILQVRASIAQAIVECAVGKKADLVVVGSAWGLADWREY